MKEHQAHALAMIFGGKPWQPYPGHWLLVVGRDDGALVVFDREAVCLYDDGSALEDGEPACEIRLDKPPELSVS